MNWLVIAAIVVIIIILLILGLSFLIPRLFPSRPATITLPAVSPTPGIVIVTPTPTPLNTITTPVPGVGGGPPATKLFSGEGITFSYPQNWGLLTCANSPNFELDPTTPVDQIKVICDFALKPVTFLVSNTFAGCLGETVTLGNIRVIRSVTRTTNFLSYIWCTQTSPVLKISHRVASTSSRAVSNTDYSSQVEALISTLTFTSP